MQAASFGLVETFSEENLGNRYARSVRTTGEAAADPAADSGTADVARSRSAPRTRHGPA